MTSATWIPFTGDDLTCACGNTTDSDGFYTCDTDRGEIEPTLDSDWDGLYCCGRCGQGYRQADDDKCAVCGDTFDYGHSNYRPVWSDNHDNLVCVSCYESV